MFSKSFVLQVLLLASFLLLPPSTIRSPSCLEWYLKPGPEFCHLQHISTTQQEQFKGFRLQTSWAQSATHQGCQLLRVEWLIFVPVWKGKFLIPEYIGEFRLKGFSCIGRSVFFIILGGLWYFIANTIFNQFLVRDSSFLFPRNTEM